MTHDIDFLYTYNQRHTENHKIFFSLFVQEGREITHPPRMNYCIVFIKSLSGTYFMTFDFWTVTSWWSVLALNKAVVL
jgi:hypothetical protein